MRGSVDGLASSSPLGAMLPAVFAEDDLAQRFVSGLDEVLAPILVVLDCLDAYFTPALAPLDFTEWLGGWIGADTDGRVAAGAGSEAAVRAAVAAAVSLHRIRGTRRGLVEAIRLAFGATPEVSESGAAGWSPWPSAPFPGEDRPRLHVTLRLPTPRAADEQRLDAIVSACTPAHIPYSVQITTAEGSSEK